MSDNLSEHFIAVHEIGERDNAEIFVRKSAVTAIRPYGKDKCFLYIQGYLSGMLIVKESASIVAGRLFD